MVERHYDDESLIALFEKNHTASDSHLTTCTLCSEKLQSARAIAGAMHDPAVWDTRSLDERPNRTTIATLRAFADRLAHEDSRAEAYLRELLAGSREEWMPRLQMHPEWRTAGVVRKLIAAAYPALTTMPPDAVEMTALAINIADHLDPAKHVSDEVWRVGGVAWREYAYCLSYTGRYPEALHAVERAEAAFSHCMVDDYELARLGIVKVLILRTFEKLDEAEEVARMSSATFLAYQDLERSASAGIAEAHLLFARSDFEAAHRILEQLERRLRHSDLAETHARVLGNLGKSARHLGRIDQSLQYLDLSTALFETLDIVTEAARTRWNAAKILLEAGRFADAHRRLDAVIRDMDRLGMVAGATMARLDVAEILLAEERFAEVEEICRAAMKSFERAGLAYTERALTALAFMREAASKRAASMELVHTVRNYMNRLPSEPNLLFALPPE